MHACLVILLTVMSVGPVYGAQLDLGRILQVLFGSEPNTRRILEDYPGCGELGTKRVFRQNDRNKLDNSCMQTCQWKRNPFFKRSFPWELYRKNKAQKCLYINEVTVFITAPMVPIDLTCLEECFSDYNFKKSSCKIPLGQVEGLNYDENAKPFGYDLTMSTCPGDRNRSLIDDSLNSFLDCLMEDNMGPLGEEASFLNIELEKPPPPPETEGGGTTEGSTSSSQFEKTLLTKSLRASSSLNLAIEICAFAKLFAAYNRKYDIKSGSTYLFQNKSCDAIIKFQADNTFDKKYKKVNKRKKKKVLGTTSKRSKRNTHPWLCTLKEKGFAGRHRCGVTLLSGPPDPILVSAAHCNYVCKDEITMELQDICCCRQPSDTSSCKEDSSYCTQNPLLTEALESELQIVCGEHSLLVQPEDFSEEDEVVLQIREIINHPDYSPGKSDGKREGPYNGSDISIYKVNASNFFNENNSSKLEKKKFYPACLPKAKETYSNSLNRGIFAAWSDPEPFYRVNNETSLEIYTLNYYFPRQAVMQEMECKDPDWMQSNSYYPQGTVCYRDPAFASCSQFGNSGASLVREFENADGEKRYAMVGPLSMSKGCDASWILFNSITFASENPSVFTDAYCYLDWIAEQYGMSVPDSYQKPDSCNKPRGDPKDIDKSVCRGRGHIYGVNTGVDSNGDDIDSYCHFNQIDDKGQKFDKCRLEATEGFAYNIFQCKDGRNNNLVCANNCKGVDPNAVVIGGTALLAATAAVGSGFLMPAIFGFGGLALAGGSTVANRMCLVGFCRVPSGQCCMLQLVRRQIRCPSRC